MTNVKKFYENDVVESSVESFVQSAENEAIEIKLIKQKSQGFISSYNYNFYRDLWEVKGINGVSCSCKLNDDAEIYGDARFVYKNQSIRQYFDVNTDLYSALENVFAELTAMYQEELKEIEAKQNAENVNFDNMGNMFDATLEALAVA